MWYDGSDSPDRSPLEHTAKPPLAKRANLDSPESLPVGVNEPCGDDIPKAKKIERKLSFDRQMKFLLKAEQDEKAESPREAATPRPEHGVHLPPGWGHSAAPATDRHRRSTTPASSSADARETPRTPRERSDYARGGGC